MWYDQNMHRYLPLILFISCFGIALFLSGLTTSASAADLTKIQDTVTQQVQQRQEALQLPASSVIKSRPTAKETEKSVSSDKTYWSIFNGNVKLHSSQGQLYLSFFSE